jgi:hypothetical protein
LIISRSPIKEHKRIVMHDGIEWQDASILLYTSTLWI